MEREKPKRLRFSYDDDIFLLREIIAHNPLRNPAGWEIIQRDMETSLGKKFLIKTLKQHLQLLLELWTKKDNITKIRSGCEDPYTEKDNLLQEVSSICEESGGVLIKKKKLMSKEKRIAELGRQARESFAINFANENDENINHNFNFDHAGVIECEEILFDPDNGVDVDHNYCVDLTDSVLSAPPSIPDAISVPINAPKNSDTEKGHVLRPIRKRINKSKTLRKDALGYLSEKNEREDTLRNRELQLETRKLLLEERKLLLEEKKMDWEITEGKEKLEIEKKKLEMMISDKTITKLLLETQQQLIESLMKQKQLIQINKAC